MKVSLIHIFKNELIYTYLYLKMILILNRPYNVTQDRQLNWYMVHLPMDGGLGVFFFRQFIQYLFDIWGFSTRQTPAPPPSLIQVL